MTDSTTSAGQPRGDARSCITYSTSVRHGCPASEGVIRLLSPHPGSELVPSGQPARPTTLHSLITRDGSTGYAAEPGRYQR
jgi:hypothetical protein